MIKRRELLIALGAGVFVSFRPSFAQPAAKVWRIGILTSYPQTVARDADRYGSFVAGLRELGYVEGRNLTIEWLFADGVYERLPGLAAELAKSNVDVIVTNGTPGARAAQRATTTIPIVSAAFSDPVGSGLVASLARPGGNITGLASMGEDIYAKRLEMLSLAAPKASRIAALLNPNNSFSQRIASILNAAAKQLDRQIQIVNASTLAEIKEAFARMARERVGAFLLPDDPFLNAHLAAIAELAERHKLPSIAVTRWYAAAGGLMSYGRDVTADYRRAATYVDKIFKGAKPGDLPIEQPTKFELVFNMKTAKALGIKLPDTILLRADKVIE